MSEILSRHELAFIEMLKPIESLSTCGRHQVGAIVYKDTEIFSMGYNGVAPGATHCCDLLSSGKLSVKDHRVWSLENEIHAEINAIQRAEERGAPQFVSLIVSKTPCPACVLKILGSPLLFGKVIIKERWTNPGIQYFVPEHGYFPSAEIALSSGGIQTINIWNNDDEIN